MKILLPLSVPVLILTTYRVLSFYNKKRYISSATTSESEEDVSTTEPVPPAPAIPPLDEDEIKDLARRVVTNQVAIDQVAFNERLGIVTGERYDWMVLMLCQRSDIPSNASTTIYTEWSNAMPTAMNGRARFTSVAFVPHESEVALVDEVNRLLQAIEGES